MITKTYAELETYIRTIDTARYAAQRNYLGGSTELSEYITRGVISLPRVRDLVLENNPVNNEKLLQELAWREYWQRVWREREDEIFEYIRPIHETRRAGLPTAVLEATTGITAIDDGIRQLYDTGYLHNHMRMWLAGLICNVAKCDWRVGADWMISYLIDGDYASNHLSWQWVAGSYTGSPYLPQQDNINQYTRTVQRCTFLDTTYEQISDMPVPMALRALTAPSDITRVAPTLPEATIELAQAAQASEILLYSPWTLDPNWHTDSRALRVLLLDTTQFTSGVFGQHVVDSIMSAARLIPELLVLITPAESLKTFQGKIIRKSYPGVQSWSGTAEPPELLHPGVPDKLYNSFSAYWKQVQKSQNKR